MASCITLASHHSFTCKDRDPQNLVDVIWLTLVSSTGSPTLTLSSALADTFVEGIIVVEGLCHTEKVRVQRSHCGRSYSLGANCREASMQRESPFGAGCLDVEG